MREIGPLCPSGVVSETLGSGPHKRAPASLFYREHTRHIKFLHMKLSPVNPVTGLPGRVPGQKDVCSLGSEDST